MFKQGVELPTDYWKLGWGEYPGFIHEQKAVLKNIVLYGEYYPELGSDRYVSPEHAKELLKIYGWEK